ncbi:DMT family transporter [Aidingimonas halophila]|uniref:EamA-like transporter family protein n=1 Tax=Aidingimonas halophila TaxID=574349 RepID=A0A1H3A0G3_9GAMM|nr:DMT family transporter [Aidingimonas halophila]GHC21303.1 transporter [Aidingimonas halophila]SDX23115.1 EamA-like transporter family protein [Aidingimonas halophila]
MNHSELLVSSISRLIGRGTGFIFAGVILGGGLSWPLMKMALENISPQAFLIWRLAFATISAFVLVKMTRQFRFPGREDWFPIISVACLQMGAFLWLITIGVTMVPAGRAALLAYTSPIWMIPLAVVWLNEKLDRSVIASLVFGLAGLAFLFLPSTHTLSNTQALLGNGLLLLAAVVWAFQIALLRRYPSGWSTLQLLPWQLLVATLGLSSLTIGFSDVSLLQGLDIRSLMVTTYVGIISTTFVFWGMLHIARTMPAISSTVSFLGIPAVGLLSSVLLLSERLDFGLVAGFVLIAVAVFIQSKNSRS